MRLLLCSLLIINAFLRMPSAYSKEYIVGIEDINYYPHYDFSSDEPRGYFFELMNLFTQVSGHQFRFQKLPVKRLYVAAKDQVDLVYPDNPRWQQYLPALYPKTYSEAVIHTLGSTMVRPEQQYLALENVKTVAVIHGFTPTRWLELKKSHKFKIVEVQDVPAALGLLGKKRVDAAVVEYNVASSFLDAQAMTDSLVIAELLPFTDVPFLLSTVKHPELIAEFNAFLKSEKKAIQALKRKFALIEQKPKSVVPEKDRKNK